MNRVFAENVEASCARMGSLVDETYSFDTDSFARCNQFDAFEREFSILGEIKPVAGKSKHDGFRATCRGYNLNGLRLLLWETEAHAYSLMRQLPPASLSDHWVVILRIQGWSETEIDGNRWRFSGNRLEIQRIGMSQSGYVSDNHSMFLFLPRADFPRLEYLLDRVADGKRATSVHSVLGSHLRALARILPKLRPSELASVADVTLAMTRVCISYDPELIGDAHSPIMMARFERAKAYIEKNMTSPSLTTCNLCAELCVSRRQLYKMFEDQGGVHRYIRNRRLEACFRLIVQPGINAAITEIAEQFGFSDYLRFRAAFRSRFGYTPSQLRELALKSPGPTAFVEWLVGEAAESPETAGRNLPCEPRSHPSAVAS